MFKIKDWLTNLFKRENIYDGLYLEKLCTDLHERCSNSAATRLKKIRESFKLTKWDDTIFPREESRKNTPAGKLLAFLVGLCNFCPCCNTDNIVIGPRGGLSVNMICSKCNARYWMTDPEWAFDTDLRVLMAFGAYIIREPEVGSINND